MRQPWGCHQEPAVQGRHKHRHTIHSRSLGEPKDGSPPGESEEERGKNTQDPRQRGGRMQKAGMLRNVKGYFGPGRDGPNRKSQWGSKVKGLMSHV